MAANFGCNAPDKPDFTIYMNGVGKAEGGARESGERPMFFRQGVVGAQDRQDIIILAEVPEIAGHKCTRGLTGWKRRRAAPPAGIGSNPVHRHRKSAAGTKSAETGRERGMAAWEVQRRKTDVCSGKL